MKRAQIKQNGKQGEMQLQIYLEEGRNKKKT